MKVIDQKIAEYDGLQKEICDYFGISMSEPFEFRDVGWWMISDDRSFYYGHGDLEDDIEDGNFYGGDIYGTSVWKKDEFTMLVYDNGCGAQPRVVMATSVEVTDPELRDKVLNA